MGVHLLLKSQLQSLSKTERHSRHARPQPQR
jgi:hypothetical protein